MIKLSLKQIIDYVKPLKIIDFKKNKDDLKKSEEWYNFYIGNIFTDSRKIEEGESGVFVCIKGENFDGHDFIKEVIDKKVKVIVIDNESKILSVENDSFLRNAVFIVVENSISFLGNVSKLIIESLKKKNKDFKVVGIAGAAGKTTTKNLLKNILEFLKFKVIASEKSFNNEIGVPLTVFKVNEDTEWLVLEMGMRGFNQVDYLCSISDPDYGIITAIGPEHLEFVSNVKGVIKAETELTNYLIKKRGFFLVPSSIKKNFKDYQYFDYYPSEKYLIKEFKIELVENDFFKTFAKIKINNKYFDLFFDTILSKAIIDNFLMCMFFLQGVLESKNGKGMIDKVIQNADKIILKSIENDRFYFQQISDNIFVINDFYNSNYLSLKSNLETVEKMFNYFEEIFLFIGDMLELGKYSNFYHRRVINRVLDYPNKVKIFFVGKYFYINRIVKKNVKYFVDFDNLPENVFKEIFSNKKKLIFIKGSRRLRLERILGRICSRVSFL